jgi:2-iminobutanoate/2-iminopropanoate deaminase
LRKVIATPKSPKTIGPYSQAIKANGFVFVSGQLPIDPASGLMPEGGVREQARIVLENVKVILEAAGSSLAKTVKTTLYLQSMNDFDAVNGIYSLVFPSAPPVRSTVEVARLPKSARLEIEVIALV